MSYRLAKSLEKLRAQINEAAPKRSIVSDGWIGDAAHASRDSDHNPWIKEGKTGVVSALDITHDPAGGVNSYALAQSLIDSRDPRIKYIISNGRIASGVDGPSPWQWRPYGGSNPHTRHVHISVRATKDQYDSETPWRFAMAGGSGGPIKRPTLKAGATGPDVVRLMAALNEKGLKLSAEMTPDVVEAVKVFQRSNGLEVDGIVGQYTWEKLEK